MRRKRFCAYSRTTEFFSNDLLIRNPLMKKKMGTPGNHSAIGGKGHGAATPRSAAAWMNATCSAAASRIRSKLLVFGTVGNLASVDPQSGRGKPEILMQRGFRPVQPAGSGNEAESLIQPQMHYLSRGRRYRVCACAPHEHHGPRHVVCGGYEYERR